MGQEDYVVCTLREVRDVTPTCRTFKFDLPRGRVLRARPGQHLVLKLETETCSFTRQFTIVLPPPQQCAEFPTVQTSFDVLIKLYEGGRASALIGEWRAGQEAPWRGPFGTFSYARNAFKFLVVFAVGTGALPMATAIESVLADEEDETRVDVLLGFRSTAEFLLGDRWREMARFWNVTLELFFSRSTKAEVTKCAFARAVHAGARIGPEDISKRAKRSEETLFLVCGTTDFEKSTIAALKALGVPTERIKKF